MKNCHVKQNTVILNLFQDPFLRTVRSMIGQRDRAAGRSSATPERGSRWALKQVQGDEKRKGGVNT